MFVETNCNHVTLASKARACVWVGNRTLNGKFVQVVEFVFGSQIVRSRVIERELKLVETVLKLKVNANWIK